MPQADQPAVVASCPKCRQNVGPNDQFCMHCGTQLAKNIRRCPRCGSFPDATDRYCIFCGETIDANQGEKA